MNHWWLDDGPFSSYRNFLNMKLDVTDVDPGFIDRLNAVGRAFYAHEWNDIELP